MQAKRECRRENGTLRARFRSRAEAEEFAQDPKNWPIYRGDMAHYCDVCGYWHLSRPSWIGLRRHGDHICCFCEQEIQPDENGVKAFVKYRDGKILCVLCFKAGARPIWD